MKFVIGLASLFLAFSAQAVPQDFDLECSLININNEKYNAAPKIQEDNLIRITVQNGQGRIQAANAPRIARDINARNLIVWEDIVGAGVVQTKKNGRWDITVLFNQNVSAVATLHSYSRSNNDSNAAWSGEIVFPGKITLKSGESIEAARFGFCFQSR